MRRLTRSGRCTHPSIQARLAFALTLAPNTPRPHPVASEHLPLQALNFIQREVEYAGQVVVCAPGRREVALHGKQGRIRGLETEQGSALGHHSAFLSPSLLASPFHPLHMATRPVPGAAPPRSQGEAKTQVCHAPGISAPAYVTGRSALGKQPVGSSIQLPLGLLEPGRREQPRDQAQFGM